MDDKSTVEKNTMNDFENITKEQFALMVINNSGSDECDDEKAQKLKKIAEKIAERFMEYKQKAIELLKNAEKLDDLLVRVDEKFKSIPKVGEKLAYIPELALMIRSYVIGDYKDITTVELVAIVTALIYFVAPIDIIPDVIHGAGLLDDAVVAGIVVSWCDEDIKKYMEWRENRE